MTHKNYFYQPAAAGHNKRNIRPGRTNREKGLWEKILPLPPSILEKFYEWHPNKPINFLLLTFLLLLQLPLLLFLFLFLLLRLTCNRDKGEKIGVKTFFPPPPSILFTVFLRITRPPKKYPSLVLNFYFLRFSSFRGRARIREAERWLCLLAKMPSCIFRVVKRVST